MTAIIREALGRMQRMVEGNPQMEALVERALAEVTGIDGGSPRRTTCAATDCAKRLPVGRPIYCSDACGERQRSRNKRGTAWGAKGERHPRTAAMWAMRAELDAKGGAGKCIFCMKQMSRLRHLQCGADQCEADYQHMYHLGEKAVQAEEAATS